MYVYCGYFGYGYKVHTHTKNLTWHFLDIGNLLFWVCCASLATPVKNDTTNLWKTLMFTWMQKKWTLFLTSFLIYYKDNANFCVLWACLDKPIKKDRTNLQKTLMFISMQKIHHSFLCSDIAKILDSTCYFEYCRHDLPHPSNMVVSTCRKLWCLSAHKINFIIHFFLDILQRYCKVFVLGVLHMPHHPNQKQ